MESGNNNDVLTATIMNASSHPSGSGWVTGGGTMWVSTSHHNDLPGPVVCGGVTYNGTGGTRSWVVNNNNSDQLCQVFVSRASHKTNRCLLLHHEHDDTKQERLRRGRPLGHSDLGGHADCKPRQQRALFENGSRDSNGG